MFSKANWIRAVSLSLLSAVFVRSVELGPNAQDMFNESMTFLDDIYDPIAGYLRYFYYPLAASSHETRSSIWYSVGLLQRNSGSDVGEAVKIIENVISGQEKDTSVQWYGDYTVYPEQPTVGSDPYAPKIYSTWDPNWRGFIGTTLIIIYEEYRSLLPENVQDLILESLKNNTIGDTYRVNGIDGDNLSPSYSNPWLMRTMTSSWTGRKLKDSNMTTWGDKWAEEFLDLFDRNQTLSEFNSPTYAGVSLYALTLAAKYLGTTDSVIGTNATRVIQEIWEYESSLWNANLRNFAGPWDRTYGLDMNNYVPIMTLWIWSFLGKKGVYKNTPPIWAMTHADDFEFAPVAAVLSDYHKSMVSNSSISRLSSFTGEHTYNGNAYAPPADLEQRNITSWLSENVTIGAQSFNQDGAGGYSKDITSWSPAVVQWLRPDESVGYFSLYTGEKAMQVDVGPNSLNLSYPLGNSSSTFTFHVPTNPLGEARDITSLEDIYGLNAEVIGGTVSVDPLIAFCGLVGGDCDVIHDFEFWSLTFSLPKGSSDVPSIHLKFSKN